jgi:two-component system sensor histidine kinase VicK
LVIETANSAAVKLWGKSNDVIGKPLQLAIPELKTQSFLQILDEVYTTGKPYFGNEEKIFFEVNGDLKEFYVNFVYHPIIDTSEETKRIIMVAHNVTEQVIAQKELEKARDLLKLAIDAAGIGIWHADLSTGILTFSEQGRTMHGIPDKITLTLTDAINLVDQEYRDQFISNVEKAIEVKERFEDVYLIRQLDNNNARWLKSHGKIYYNEQGAAEYATGATLDITQQKQDDIRKNDFIGMVSHELKTPLTTLNAYVQLLQLRLKPNEDEFTTAALEKVGKQVKKMAAMIAGFLNLSRLESGKIQLVKKHFILQELINDVIDECTLVTSHDKITLIPGELTTVYADREKISSVISNLLGNAFKYSAKDKPIEVKCEQKENMVLVSVRDQGMGIEQQHLSKLFDRFYRVESPQTKTISGFGIGLYVCAEIISQHVGKIWVESELEKGSIFYFSLPMQE